MLEKIDEDLLYFESFLENIRKFLKLQENLMNSFNAFLFN